MIRETGYYVSPAKPITDSRSNDSWFSRKAFLFQNNGTVRVAIKFFSHEIDSTFNLSDFKPENDCKYSVNQNRIEQICHPENPILENKVQMEIISKKEIKYADHEDIFTFVEL